MNPKGLIQKVQDLVTDTKNLPRHMAWNREAVNSVTAYEEMFDPYTQALDKPQYFRAHMFRFVSFLRNLEVMASQYGFDPKIIYMTDILTQKNSDGSEYFLVGLMYPLERVYAPHFPHVLSPSFSEYVGQNDSLASAVETVATAFSAIEFDRIVQFNLDNSVDFAMSTFFIGPRNQIDVNTNAPTDDLNLDPTLLDAINLELSSAYKRVPPRFYKDEDALEA